MTERDRVLDAFRNCITEPKCKDCPWTECETIGHDTIKIPRDLALAVMRELVSQEPRVMTLEELSGICVEFKNDLFPISLVNFDLGKIICRMLDGSCRLWSSRPSVEQRENTPWED